MRRIANAIRSWFLAWISDPSQIKSEFKWSINDQCFFVNSKYGQIKYTPKSLNEMIKFRDDIGNRMLVLDSAYRKGGNDLKQIYYDSIKIYRAEYYATMRMRWSLVFQKN
jgi:hypothetical protein